MRFGPPRKPGVWAGFAWSLCAAAPTLAVETDLNALFTPFAAKHCTECHGERKQKGDLRLDSLSRDLSDPKVAIHWQDVVDALKGGEMPPEEQPRPPAGDVARMVAAIDGELRAAAEKFRGNARIAIRRLSHSAMDNSARDLLGLDLPLSRDLPVDPEVAGFENMAQTLATTQEFLAGVQRNARMIAREAIVEGPDPRANRDFPFDRLDHGARVYRSGSALALWSSKNRLDVVWPKGFVAPRPGNYRVRFTAMARDTRLDYDPGVPDYGDRRIDRNTAPSHPPDTPRILQIVALRADEVRSIGGESTGGRQVGQIRLSDTFADYEIECALEAGENIFLHYLSVGRMQVTPLGKVDGKEILLGEAAYVRNVGMDGPLVESWPPLVHVRLLGSKTGAESDDELEQRLRAFTSQAFRRPVADDALARYTGLYRQSVGQGFSREAAMRLVVEAVLCSPRFLYLPDDSEGSDAWAVASRLAYFLWNSPPDEALLAAAASGDLLKPEVIAGHARRLLADGKRPRFVRDFTAQWLHLKRVGAMLPDPKLFPAYDKALEIAMRRETEAFFEEILSRNLPVTTFLDSDFAMLNERLARHYGIPGVRGEALRRVALPAGSQRGGLLAHASFLTITSNGSRTSPVVRGVWILENLLDAPPSPPPPNIEPLEPDVRGATTIREMLAKHRKIESCNDCHSRIDPYGFSLEHFDAIGAWRDFYGGNRVKSADGEVVQVPRQPIDSSGHLLDGTKFDGFEGMKQALVAKPERFARALAGKLLSHALGHQLSFAERHAVERLAADNLARRGGFADLIVALCASESFLGRPVRLSSTSSTSLVPTDLERASPGSNASISPPGLNASAFAFDDPALVKANGVLLFEDDFERDEPEPDKEHIGNGWTTNSAVRAKGNKQVDLVDGAMHIAKHALADHGVGIFHAVAFQDGAVELKFKLGPGDDLALDFVDRELKSVHAGHLCIARVKLDGITLNDWKTGVMDNAIRARRLAGDKSPEIEALLKTKTKSIPLSLSEEWHTLLVVVEGDAMRATIDGKPVGELRSAGVAHPTKRMITLAANKSAMVDAVRVWKLK